jgi:hypothetical protein
MLVSVCGSFSVLLHVDPAEQQTRWNNNSESQQHTNWVKHLGIPHCQVEVNDSAAD